MRNDADWSKRQTTWPLSFRILPQICNDVTKWQSGKMLTSIGEWTVRGWINDLHITKTWIEIETDGQHGSDGCPNVIKIPCEVCSEFPTRLKLSQYFYSAVRSVGLLFTLLFPHSTFYQWPLDHSNLVVAMPLCVNCKQQQFTDFPVKCLERNSGLFQDFCGPDIF